MHAPWLVTFPQGMESLSYDTGICFAMISLPPGDGKLSRTVQFLPLNVLISLERLT